MKSQVGVVERRKQREFKSFCDDENRRRSWVIQLEEEEMEKT
jgi:hypothetical protein